MAEKKVYEVNGKKFKTTSLANAQKLYAKEYGSSGSSSSSKSGSSSGKTTATPQSNLDIIRDNVTGNSYARDLSDPKSTYKLYTPPAPQTDLSGYINGTQAQDQQSRAGLEEPDTRSSTDKSIDTLVQSLAGLKPPKAYSAEKTFEDLRDEYGIERLEEDLTTLQDEERELSAYKRQRVNAQLDKPVTLGVIEGRVGEVERQENERIDSVQREIAYKSSQLETKYNVINTVMSLRQTDYQNAYQEYTTKFSQAVSMINVLEARAGREEAREDRQRQNARADLQILWTAAQERGLTFDALPDTQKMLMAKLDAEAQLPVGFSQFITQNLPKNQEILSSVQSADGSSVSLIMRDKAGNITTQVVKTGVISKTPTKTTVEEKSDDWAAARQLIKDNPNATREELRAAIRENTDLAVTDADTLLDEAKVTTGSNFSDDQLRKIATQIVPKLGDVEPAKAYINSGSITSGGKKYTLSRTEQEKINGYIDEAYPNGRTTLQKILPWGK